MRRFDPGTVFISHASIDREFAGRLDADLRGAGFETWLDQRDLHAGDRLTASLSGAIGSARAMIAVISPSTRSARWMRRELEQASHRMVEDHEFKVIPVLIADAEVPETLRDLVYADFRTDYALGMDAVLSSLRELFRDNRYYKDRARQDRMTGYLREVFGGFSSAIALGGYGIPDLDIVHVARPAGARVPEFDPPDDPCDVAVEIDPGEIDALWIEGFTSAWDHYGARAGLLIIDEPPATTSLEPIAAGVFANTRSRYGFICAVLVEPESRDGAARDRLEIARTTLQEHIWPDR